MTSAGAWVRVVFDYYSILWFGADKTGVADAQPAVQRDVVHQRGKRIR